MNSNTNTNIKHDIVQQQQKIIEALRAKNTSLEETNAVVTEENASLLAIIAEYKQKISYYREVQADYNKLQAQIGKNPQLYYQIVQPYDPKEEYCQVQQQQQAIAQREAQRAQAEEDRKQEILKAHPHIRGEFKERKAKAEAAKTMMLEKATQFYDMTEAEAQTYINVPHRPEESAVKHLILEYQEGPDALTVTPKPTVYQCSYCEDKFYSVGEFERDAYLNGSDHQPATLKRIEEDYNEEIADATKEMEKEIFLAGQAANNAAVRAAAESKRVVDEKAKKTLPFVSK